MIRHFNDDFDPDPQDEINELKEQVVELKEECARVKKELLEFKKEKFKRGVESKDVLNADYWYSQVFISNGYPEGPE